MSSRTLDRSYKHGDLSIDVNRIPNQFSYHLQVTAYAGDFYKEKQCSRSKFGDGERFLEDFNKDATEEYRAHQARAAEQAATDEIDRYIDAARQHRLDSDSDSDAEAGDLQQYLRSMWALLTPQQREQFVCDERVIETYESARGALSALEP